VSVDDVCDVINVGSAEVSDAKVLKMIKRAEVTLEHETASISVLQATLMGIFLFGLLSLPLPRARLPV